jgi:hypothetical protein
MSTEYSNLIWFHKNLFILIGSNCYHNYIREYLWAASILWVGLTANYWKYNLKYLIFDRFSFKSLHIRMKGKGLILLSSCVYFQSMFRYISNSWINIKEIFYHSSFRITFLKTWNFLLSIAIDLNKIHLSQLFQCCFRENFGWQEEKVKSKWRMNHLCLIIHTCFCFQH